MLRSLLLALLTVVILTGCLPIELEVGPDGRTVIPREEGFFALAADGKEASLLYRPADGEPVFARFFPDGKQLLAISKVQGQGMGVGHLLERVNLADGSAKKLVTTSNVTYALISPDGKTVSYTRLADEQKPGFEKNLPELRIIDVATGTDTALLPTASVAVLHRWFADAKSIFAFVIDEPVVIEEGQQRGGDLYHGRLVRISVPDGKITPLAQVIGSNDTFFDVAPNDAKALFTAMAAGKVGDKLTPGEAPVLHELTIATGELRRIEGNFRYAIYSPDGKHVLTIGTDDSDQGPGPRMGGMGGSDRLKLTVTDASLGNPVVVARDAMAQAGGMMGSASIYPAWQGNDTVLYIAGRHVYGNTATNYMLTRVSTDAKTRAILQPVIDTAAVTP